MVFTRTGQPDPVAQLLRRAGDLHHVLEGRALGIEVEHAPVRRSRVGARLAQRWSGMVPRLTT